ncbi:hypothetical protein RB195_004809 [Necator americanus]|uniref:Uncharacterized protein n=1 Tax=Necator americanus TaxID=51031 RepID=A0ABR1BJS5_NECAM
MFSYGHGGWSLYRAWLSDQRKVRLLIEHERVVTMRYSNILGIRTAFGAGKTVVCGIIAGQWGSGGFSPLATVSNNAAIAQFAPTMLLNTTYKHLNILRFVSNSAAQEKPTLARVNTNKILVSLGETHFDRSTCD